MKDQSHISVPGRIHFFGAGCHHRLRCVLGILFCAPIGVKGDTASGTPPEFRQVPALPSVRQAAKAAGFQLEGFAAPAWREELRAGDTVTLLVTRTGGSKTQQWVIELEADHPTKTEAKQAEEPEQFHTSTGNSFTLGGGVAALNLRVTGPLERKDEGTRKATAPRAEQRRVLVSPDYLGLGLDRLPALMLRIEAALKANPPAKNVEFSISQSAFPAEVVAAARRQLGEQELKTRKADELAFIGTFLAMQEFFLIANSTPGIQEVLRSVVDVPWWSIISRGGKTELNFNMLPKMREIGTPPWGLPTAQRIYALPFRLEINGNPSLLFQIAVTRPRPPLIVSAGVVGFAAGPVNGNGPVLTFQIVSSRTRLLKN